MKKGSMTAANLLWQPQEKRYHACGRCFQGIPAIERTHGGRLYAAWYTGMNGEVCGNFIDVEKSDDDGRTWSDAWLIIEHEDPEVRCFDECIWRDPSGRIWIFWSQSEKGQFDGRVGVWEIHSANADEEQPSFSEPRRIANGIMLNKPTVLTSGEWLMPCSLWGSDYVQVSGEGHPELASEIGANLYVSMDNGESFTYRGGALIPGRVFDEHSVIERLDGSLWMLTRTVYGIGQAFSYDKGFTWEGIGPSGHTGPNSRFHIRRLSTGDLLLINHVNPTNHSSENPWRRRDNLMAMLSQDDGKTWIGGLMIDVRADISYPDATEGPDGRIYMIYDHSRNHEREILMSVFRPEDIMAGGFLSQDARPREVINRATGTA